MSIYLLICDYLMVCFSTLLGRNTLNFSSLPQRGFYFSIWVTTKDTVVLPRRLVSLYKQYTLIMSTCNNTNFVTIIKFLWWDLNILFDVSCHTCIHAYIYMYDAEIQWQRIWLWAMLLSYKFVDIITDQSSAYYLSTVSQPTKWAQKHLTQGWTDCSAVAAHAHTSLHDIHWANSSIFHTEHDFKKHKISEALLIQTTKSFNQDSCLTVSPIWTSILPSCIL